MDKKKRIKHRFRLGLNLFLAGMEFWQWLSMVFVVQDGVLSATGLGSLKYFTVLSNLLEGAASLLWGLCACREKHARLAARVKYIAAVSVGLTFVTVLVFLGPFFGYGGMYTGSNFWFHLILPLAAMAEFMLLNDAPMTHRDNRLAVAPMLLYGIGYLANNLINGIGAWPHTNDFYAFLTWGYPVGMVILVVIIVGTYGIGWLLRQANSRMLLRLAKTVRKK
ncbi:MAG: hypothetical protein IJ189_04370 [Clostridia bacterium]|nr:hypothetical protein [Clostridia bacterium]